MQEGGGGVISPAQPSVLSGGELAISGEELAISGGELSGAPADGSGTSRRRRASPLAAW